MSGRFSPFAGGAQKPGHPLETVWTNARYLGRQFFGALVAPPTPNWIPIASCSTLVNSCQLVPRIAVATVREISAAMESSARKTWEYSQRFLKLIHFSSGLFDA